MSYNISINKMMGLGFRFLNHNPINLITHDKKISNMILKVNKEKWKVVRQNNNKALSDTST
jgi:hypothetical protein